MRKQHRFRALRNLAIAAALLLFLWYLKGCPLPTEEMEMHRNERQHLLPESRVVWEYSGSFSSDRDMLVGLGETHITTHMERDRSWFWPRSRGEPTLVLLPGNTRYNPQGTAHSYLDPAFIAVDPPARAQSARLQVLLSYNQWEEVYTVEGQKQGSVWFFQMEQRYYAVGENPTEKEELGRDYEHHALSLLGMDGQTGNCNYPCTLEFFDKDGVCISTVEIHGGAVQS